LLLLRLVRGLGESARSRNGDKGRKAEVLHDRLLSPPPVDCAAASQREICSSE
jgi:hypothetical protein